jgi:putative tryptophan/tyrosine transport system substrate-binding protein
MRLIGLAVILALSLVLPLPPAEAQEAGKVWRIGFLSPYGPDYDEKWRAAFRSGMRDLGYVEGKNLVIEERHARGRFERFPEMAADLVRFNLDVFVVHGGLPAINAARKASTSVPIVMPAVADPVGMGLVASLARPGGNITGLSDLHSDMNAKRLELLKETVPSLSRVAVLLNPSFAVHPAQWKDLQNAAPALRVTLVLVEMKGPEDIDQIFMTIRKERAEALNLLGGAATIHTRRVADLAVKHRIPTISTTKNAAEEGLLMSYGADFRDLYRRAATYVDKIFRGAKPADLPVEQPTKFELVVNLKTAKALGLAIPQSVLVRADEIIQ